MYVLQSSRVQSRAPYSEEFSVREDLMGLAIGTHGSNIQNARKIEGILGIDLDENTCTFTVHGESDSAVKNARNMLEYGEQTYQVPRDLIGKLHNKSS